MEWYAEAESREAGKSYGLFLERMKKDTLENATGEERKRIAPWGLEIDTSPFKDLPRAKGPGRYWTVEDVTNAVRDLKGADKGNGKRMFQAGLCMACHRVGGEGGAAGPDLTAVAGRFTLEELAVAIVHPSKEISSQYQFSVIEKKDGSTLSGKILDEKDEVLIVATSALDFSQTTEVERGEIKSITPSKISPMPPALINQFNKKELRDMFAWLLEAG